MDRVLDRLALVFDVGLVDGGGWYPKHVLSHLAGAWQRVPIHSAFYLDGSLRDVPIQLRDKYWIAEWETAPLEAFRLAIKTAYIGNRAFVSDLNPSLLSRRLPTTLGEMSLGELLYTSYKGHIGNFHTPQLEVFLSH